MSGLLNDIANIFNTGGTMNTVVWFFALTVFLVIYAIAGVRAMIPLILSAAAAFLASFSKMDLVWQAVVFALGCAVGLFYMSRRNNKNTEEDTEDGREEINS